MLLSPHVGATSPSRGLADIQRGGSLASSLARKSGLGLVLSCILAVPALAAAGAPPDRPAEPSQEVRAHALFRQIRCVVCQNESIDDSEAELAGDLRRIVREQIAAGASDADIRRFLTDRYGEFVLLKPRLSPANAALWGAPFAIVLVGGALFALRRRPAAVEAPLSADEAQRLRAWEDKATLPPDPGLTKGASRV